MELVGLSVDVRRLVQMMGQSMYAGDVQGIAVKELLQNSYDALKAEIASKRKISGEIQFSVDCGENSMTIIDNGCGMTAQTIKSAFLSLGGTLKDLALSERSGGLGVAKAQFFATTKRMVVESVRNGVKSGFDAGIEDIFAGTVKLDSVSTDAPNGTKITFFYPNEVHLSTRIPQILNRPIINHWTNVLWDGKAVCQMPGWVTDKMTFNFSWADIDVYIDVNDQLMENGDQEIYSAGLFQFKYDFHQSSVGYLKLKTLLDVKPKVPAEADEYPFNLQRQGFKAREDIKEDLKTIGSYLFDLQYLIRQEQIYKEFASMETLDYVALDATTAPVQHLDRRCRDPFSEEFRRKVADFIMSVEPSTYKESPVVTSTKLEAKQRDASEKSNSLRYENKTDKTFSECRLLFSKVASATMDALELLPDNYKKDYDYPVVTGVTIDTRIEGYLLKGTNKALCVNPLLCRDASSQETWVLYMCYVFIHEATHIKRGYHDDAFCVEMGELWQQLQLDGTYERIAGLFRTVFQQHGEEILQATLRLKD